MRQAAPLLSVAGLLLLGPASLGDGAGADSHDYCVVGAGPAGLQLGLQLQDAGRDYVILERASGPGAFFTRYPVHRKLISINKRHTGRQNKEFNMRHDWNSLLDSTDLSFRDYSRDYFPHADTYVEYLKDFAAAHHLSVRYRTDITGVERSAAGGFRLTSAEGGAEFACAYVVVATGLPRPNIPDIAGIEHAVGYEDMSIEPGAYENKSVLILGKQQSAFETANHIYGETANVMMVSRGRPRLAWETHYVGDLRAINAQFLDAYQLKSMDTVIDDDMTKFEPFIKRPDGKIALANGQRNKEMFALKERVEEAFDFWDVVIRCTGWLMDLGPFAEGSRPETTHHSKYPRMSPSFESTNVRGLWFAGTLMHGNDWRKSSGGFIHGFRYLVRALGKILELENHGTAWPSHTVSTHAAPIPGARFSSPRRNTVQLATEILRRSSEMSGPYQMFSVLMDLYAFTDDGRCLRYDEVPASYLPALLNRTAMSHYITVTFEYKDGYSGPGHDTLAGDDDPNPRVVRPLPLVECFEGVRQECWNASGTHVGPGSVSNFIHPVLRYDCFDSSSCQDSVVYHVAEDIHTSHLRTTIDIEPLADHLEKQEVLRHNPKKPPQPPQDPGDETSPAAEGIIREIRDVYAEHNPDKLASVPGLLAKYAGQEQALLDSVRQKYGVAHGEL